MALLVATDTSFARRRRYYNYDYTYYTTGWKQIAVKEDAESSSYPMLQVYCDYDRAQAEDVAFTDRVRVFVNIWDKKIQESGERLVAEVKITDLTDAQTTYVRYLPVTISQVADAEYVQGSFELSNDIEEEPIIRPARIYRVFVNLHREAADYGQQTAWGRLPGPYYVATSGESALDHARQRIAMRTFREWYYTERGWNRNAEYPMDCHAYYCWATGSVTKDAMNGWTNPDALFGGDTPYVNGGQIASLMQHGPIHGDYVRIPGHTFMLLAYDPQTAYVWTMEGNYGATIKIVQRSADASWTVGHLQPEHIRQDLFPGDNIAEQASPDMMARLKSNADDENHAVQ